MTHHSQELQGLEKQVHEFVEQNKGKIPSESIPLLEEVLHKVMVESIPFQEAIGFSPEIMEEIYQYGYSLFQSGKYQEALPVFNLLRFIDGTNERYVLAIAASYHHMQNYEEAAGHYMLCELMNPEDPIPYYHLADCFVKLNQVELALNAMKLASQLAAKDSKYLELKEKADLELKHFQTILDGSKEG